MTPEAAREALFQLAVKAVELAKKLPSTPAGDVLASQLIGATGGAVAQLEAQFDEDEVSKADLAYATVAAKRAAREARVWLKLAEAGGVGDAAAVKALSTELDHLLKTLTNSAREAKKAHAIGMRP